MSTVTSERIPPLTLAWRLRMSMETARIGRDAMAEHLGVSASTISRWCKGKGAEPSRAYVMQWALVTGVPSGWLASGETGPSSPSPGPGKDAGDRTRAVAELAAKKRGRRTRGYFAVSPIHAGVAA